MHSNLAMDGECSRATRMEQPLILFHSRFQDEAILSQERKQMPSRYSAFLSVYLI